MTRLNIQGLAAGLTILGVVWAAILFLADPSTPVLAALAVASIGLLVLTLTTDDDQDDGPPTADDLADE